MNNKLFCTFVKKEFLENTLNNIILTYREFILYNKIFIFNTKINREFVLTYNVDLNLTKPELIPNTILVHRKKETNTLYTINALNTLIQYLNNGIKDSTFIINWNDYKNTLLLTNKNELKNISLELDEIVYLE